MATNTLVPVPTEGTLDLTVSPRLPSIADIQQRMTWMGEFRRLLVQYVEEQMDPSRHMYSFESGGYHRIQSKTEITAMLAKGQKPALNQDGIHNLLAVYEADFDAPHLEECREDGHYQVRIMLPLRYFGGRRVVGFGSCSTRESKYAYRWVNANQVPAGVDKSTLKSRTFTPQGRQAYTRYRLDNDDLADVESTVLQIAFKRAKSSAVKALPGVSEIFAEVGDPGETEERPDEERQVVLAPLQQWLRGMRATTQARALLAVFGEPLRVNDVPALPLDRLIQAGQVVEIATRAGLDWSSTTVAADLKAVLARSAQQAQEELYGERQGGGQPGPVTDVDPTTGEIRNQPDLWQREEAQEGGGVTNGS